jgi:hypothetical protein
MNTRWLRGGGPLHLWESCTTIGYRPSGLAARGGRRESATVNCRECRPRRGRTQKFRVRSEF